MIERKFNDLIIRKDPVDLMLEDLPFIGAPEIIDE